MHLAAAATVISMAGLKKPGAQAAQAEVSLQQLKNCLVNLPPSLVSALVDSNTVSNIAPSIQSSCSFLPQVAQNVIVELTYRRSAFSAAAPNGEAAGQQSTAFLGWTGMPSKRKLASVIGRGSLAGREQEVNTVEIDHAFARTLGMDDGQKVQDQ